jgi:hypothetical protein
MHHPCTPYARRLLYGIPSRFHPAVPTSGEAAQTREHLFRHCKKWKSEQRKAFGPEIGWKAGRCRHVQISELFSLEMRDQAVLDFLAATEVGKFPRC